LDAQPEQLESVVRRIFFSEGVSVLLIIIFFKCEATEMGDEK